MEDCFICSQHRGTGVTPPGGYLYEDEYWMVSHAPAELGLWGTLFIETKWHYEKGAQLRAEDDISFLHVFRKACCALGTINTEHELEMIFTHRPGQGQAHYQIWLVPLRREDVLRGLRFLEKNAAFTEEAAVALAEKLREKLK